MVASLRAGSHERQQRLKHALSVLTSEATDLNLLKKKIALGKTSWLVADLVDGLCQHYKMPPPPKDFTIIATDGSHIDVDRHRQTRCYLINIGRVTLNYGTNPGAVL